MSVTILTGDCRDLLRTLPERSVQCCVTSPPYFGLRDYGHDGQIGLEATPTEFVDAMVAVFREVRRVLRDDGTLWLNLGDSYAAQRGGTAMPAETIAGGVGGKGDENAHRGHGAVHAHRNAGAIGLKHKDLIGIPWRVAFALQTDGWWLRSAIVWHKPNPMPESVTDRPTSAYEMIFLLAKSERYFYDHEAVKEPASWLRENNPDWQTQRAETNAKKGAGNRNAADGGFTKWSPDHGRNRRNVWTVPTKPFSGAHFATFPPALIEPCIKAGSRPGDTVLDPFGGAGTTGLVADRLGRNATLIELNPAYAAMARERITGDAPLFAECAS